MCCQLIFFFIRCICSIVLLFNDQGSTVQTIDQVLQNNLTLVNTLLNGIEDQENHDWLKTYGIEKCHIKDVR